MAHLLTTLSNLFKSCLEGAPPKPAILDGLEDRIGQLLAVSADPGGEGVERWLAALRSITGDVALRDTLVVRALQVKLPRLAEALAFAGAFDVQWTADGAPVRPLSFTINWTRISDLARRTAVQAAWLRG